MFLNVLTRPQQAAFVHAARAMLRADGQVVEAELALMEAIHAECDLPEVETFEGDAVAEAVAVLDSVPARNAFMLELAGVAVIDGEAHDAELALLGEFAAGLGVAEERLQEFVAFAERANALVQDGRELLALEAR